MQTIENKSILRKLALTSLIVSSLFVADTYGADRYYRYINEEGVTVMDSVVPPEYAKNGYEVVTISGTVIEVIPPAPTTAELEAEAAERIRQAELAKWDAYLMRRYSTVADVEAAKKRKLADFDGSLGILRGNASNVRNRIAAEQAKAADLERSGRAVPETLLTAIAELQAELAEAEEKIKTRLAEKQEVADRFDRDRDRLKIITGDE